LRSGVSAERRHLKKSGKVCGGLPTRRYGAGESSTVPLKIRAIKKAASVSEGRSLQTATKFSLI